MTDFSSKRHSAMSFWAQQEATVTGRPANPRHSQLRPVGTPAASPATPPPEPVSTPTPVAPQQLSASSPVILDSPKSPSGSRKGITRRILGSGSKRKEKEKPEPQSPKPKKSETPDRPAEKPAEKPAKKKEEKKEDKPKKTIPLDLSSTPPTEPKDKTDYSKLAKALSPRLSRKKEKPSKDVVILVGSSTPGTPTKSDAQAFKKTTPDASPSSPGPSAVSGGSLTHSARKDFPSASKSMSSADVQISAVNVSSPTPNPATPGPVTPNASSGLIEMPVQQVKKPAFMSKDQRENVVYEIYSTESDYVQDLKIIVEMFLNPLKESKILSVEDITKIFSTVEMLLPLHVDFLQQISKSASVCKIIQTGSSPSNADIGQCFIYVSQYLKMYSQYCSNQPLSHKTFEQVKKSNTEFNDFLYEVSKNPECKLLDLAAFLIKPMQRVCKYPLLLRELLRTTPENHPDYKHIAKALEMMSATVSVINDSKRQFEESEVVLTVQSKMIYGRKFPPNEFPIIAPGRKLLERGKCTWISNDFKQHSVKWFLFNDIFILTTPRYKLKKYVPIKTALVGHVSVEGAEFAFEVIHCGQDKIWLAAKEDERNRLRQLCIDAGMIDRVQEQPVQPNGSREINTHILEEFSSRPIPIPSARYQETQKARSIAQENLPGLISKPLPSIPGKGPSNSAKPLPSVPPK